jgi:hypothetical protein
MKSDHPFPGVDISVVHSDSMERDDLQAVHDLFDRSYEQANHEYLDHSLARLRQLGRAYKDGSLLGFALGDVVEAELPRLDGLQVLVLGGIGCVDPGRRRSGLFSHIANRTVLANGRLVAVRAARRRVLACGRMGHPAGFRSLNRMPSVVPSESCPPSRWHLEIAAVVADLYGSRLKPGSMVVEGSGRPIGYPRIEIDVEEEEWRVFENVHRDRGDSLLGLAWAPDAPDGW